MEKFVKLWKPPSFDDFESSVPTKRTKQESPEARTEDAEHLNIHEVTPATLQDLATPTKKVDEVKRWLELALGTNRGGMLVLAGPTGSGKTSTLKLVAAALHASLHEWVTPMDKGGWKAEELEWRVDAYDKVAFYDQGQLDKFEDFVFRISRYTPLFDRSHCSVTLVEDYPNIFVWDPSSFHKFLGRYHARGKSPIVFICTEDQQLNLHQKLFPNHIKQMFGIDTVKFNPVTKASIVKVLARVLNDQSDQLVEVSKQTLENISDSSRGDVRSAVSGLQVLLVGLKTPMVKPSKRRKKSRKSDDVSAEQAITNKDGAMEFYQVIGRVLYPKRLATCDRAKVKPTAKHDRCVFVYDVFELSASFSNSFLSMLHENYLQTFRHLRDLVEGSEWLSQSDVLCGGDGSSEYGAAVAVIGLMKANTEPKRGGFQPLKKSTNLTPKPEMGLVSLRVTTRELYLDVIPFIKKLPEWSWKLEERSSDRFLRPGGKECMASISQRSQPMEEVGSDCDDNMDIEEDTD